MPQPPSLSPPAPLSRPLGSDATQAVHRWRTLESSLLQGSRVLGKGRTGDQAGGGKRPRA